MRRARGQTGMTLLEVLIAIFILSIVTVGLFAGLSTTLGLSADNQRSATLNQVLASTTESLRDLPYQRCRTAGELTTAYNGWSDGYRRSGYDVTVLDVTYAAAGGTTFTSTCPTGDAPMKLRVQVSVTATAATVTGEVIVRQPTARPA